MSNLVKRRETILVAAGLLFGATMYGWWQHAGLVEQRTHGKTGVVSQAVPTSATEHAGAAPPQETASLPAKHADEYSAGSKNIRAADSFGTNEHATSLAGITAAARSMSGRTDPLAGSRMLAIRSRRDHFYPAAARKSDRLADSLVLPPPPDPVAVESPVSDDRSRSVPASSRDQLQSPALSSLSLKEAVKLVGLLDGKAIFVLPGNYAKEHNLFPTFTLGAGQQYAGIKVESVNDKSATISDGKSICVKDIGPIN